MQRDRREELLARILDSDGAAIGEFQEEYRGTLKAMITAWLRKRWHHLGGRGLEHAVDDLCDQTLSLFVLRGAELPKERRADLWREVKRAATKAIDELTRPGISGEPEKVAAGVASRKDQPANDLVAVPQLGEPIQPYLARLAATILLKARSVMPPVERRVFFLRYVGQPEPLSERDCAQILGMTRRAVRHATNQAFMYAKIIAKEEVELYPDWVRLALEAGEAASAHQAILRFVQAAEVRIRSQENG